MNDKDTGKYKIEQLVIVNKTQMAGAINQDFAKATNAE